MIVFDTETTGLIGHPSLPLDKQPEIIELCAVKLDDTTLIETGRLDFLVRPSRLPLPPEITKITKITTEMVEREPSFARRLPLLQSFFCGESLCVAHNCAYDIGMLQLELRRLDRMHKFPWPYQQACTVELTTDLRGHRLKLGELYTIATGREIDGAHRAMNDVLALCDVVRWLRAQERI